MSDSAADDSLEARDIADVVGAEDVDEVAEATLQLVVVVGDVPGKISVAAVGLLQRPVFVVAEGRRLEQRLDAVFPLGIVMTFGLLELALVDQALFSELFDRRFDLIPAARLQRGFGEKDIVANIERREIVLDHRHHLIDGE